MTRKQLLDNTSNSDLNEYMALAIIDDEERKRAELAAKAQSRVKRTKWR